MTIDDLEVDRCPFCSGEMIELGSFSVCEDCGYTE